MFGLLRRAPSFRLLFLATLASGIGTTLALITLMVDVYDRTHSDAWVAALLIVDFLPMLAIGLLLGPLVDRFPRRRVMIAADLVRFGTFAALPFAPDATTIVVLAGVVGLATGFFRPAVYAGLPALVADRDLPRANSLFQAVENITLLLGPLAGGVILAATSPDVPYVINAITFLFSAALLARIPRPLLAAGEARSAGHWRDLAEGFAAVRRSRALMTVLVAWTIVMIGNGSMNVSEVVLAKVSLDGGNFGFGLLMATSGLGLTLGSIVGGGLLERSPIERVYVAALAVMAFGCGLAAVSPDVWLAAAFLIVFGLGNGVALVCNPLFVQRGAPDRLRGRAFALVMSVNFAVLGLAIAVAGPLTDAVGARWVWAAAASSYVVAALAAVALARGAHVESRDQALAVAHRPLREHAP